MSDIAPHSDETLLRRSAAGDEAAFTELYRRRQGSVYRFALHMSGKREVAEEVTQEVFLTLIRDASRFDSSRGTVAAYLLGVARNQVLRLFARDRVYMALAEEDERAAPPVDATALGDLTRTQAIESVRAAVLTLPGVYREAVVLCDLEELSYADAAATLGVPVGTVRSRLNRGRAMLAARLKSGVNAMRCFA